MPHKVANHQTIYFLADEPGSSRCRLMMYQTFAWPVHRENTLIQAQPDCLKAFSPEVDLLQLGYRQGQTDRFNQSVASSYADKIIKATVLPLTLLDKSVVLRLVVQTSTKMTVFLLNDKENAQELCSGGLDDMMARLPLVRGPNS